MASALNTKINSYPLERGIEFSEAYSLTPTRTGTNALGSYLVQNSPVPTFEPSVGPLGGAGSWRYNCPTSSAPRFNTTATAELAGLDDEDWSQGFWFKMSALPTLTTPTSASNGITVFAFTPASSSAGWVASVVPSNSTLVAAGSVPLAGRLLYGFNSSNTVYTPVLQPDTWYYIAARRTGTTMSAYFNGQLLGTVTNSALTAVPARLSFSSSSHGATNNPQIWISNFYQATATAVNATAISEIWSVGSTAPSLRTVRYFNGTSWVDSIGQKVWNGTAWDDWNAKRFDGSTWVNV
jgi:hypothetical protein